jgi:hypothetical protein
MQTLKALNWSAGGLSPRRTPSSEKKSRWTPATHSQKCRCFVDVFFVNLIFSINGYYLLIFIIYIYYFNIYLLYLFYIYYYLFIYYLFFPYFNRFYFFYKFYRLFLVFKIIFIFLKYFHNF